LRRGIAFALASGMTRMTAALVLAISLNAWPTHVSAQASLKTPVFLNAPFRAHRMVLPTMDRQALSVAANVEPWRPTLSTGPITALPQRVSWNRSHTALASVFVVTLLIDAAQTRALARGGWSNFRESNPLLGERPSVGRVNSYTALAGLSVLGAAAALPPRLRPWLLGAAIAVQAVTIHSSMRQGLPIRFP
jgi:hypothetical protein